MIIPLLWIVLFGSMILAAGVVVGIMDVAEAIDVGYKVKNKK